MPPAFILSQNQTLKFNCLKSLLAKSNNGSNYFLLSLCWLAFKVLVVLTSYFEKLTEITFHLLVCQIKSHFFLIPFLICFFRTTVRSATSSATACISYHNPLAFVKHFFELFLKFFNFFKVFFLLRSFFRSVSCSLRDSLYILPLYFYIVKRFFTLF